MPQAAGTPDVVSNVYRDDPKPFRLPRLAYMQASAHAPAPAVRA